MFERLPLKLRGLRRVRIETIRPTPRFVDRAIFFVLATRRRCPRNLSRSRVRIQWCVSGRST